MSLRKNRYKRELINKKMTLTILYGLVFLLSTIAYYFVSISEGQNVLQISVSIRDKDSKITDSNFELKIAENEKQYKAKIAEYQGEFIAEKYLIVSKEEFDKYKEIKPEVKTEETINKVENTTNEVKSDIEKTNVVTKNKSDAKKMTEESNKIVNNIVDNSVNENESVKSNVTNKTINNTSEKNTNNSVGTAPANNIVTNSTTNAINNVVTNDITNKSTTNVATDAVNNTAQNIAEKIEKKEADIKYIEVLPNEEFLLTEEQIKNKKVYILAIYKTKEVNKTKLYDKIISQKCGKTSIVVTGFMPQNAQVNATEVDTTEVEDKIKKGIKRDIKLQVAYDVKIVVDGKEFEPEFYDENVSVQIINNENKNVNIWHVKNDDNIEKIESEKKDNSISFNTDSFSIYGIEAVTEDDLDENNTEQTIDNNVENIIDDLEDKQNITEDNKTISDGIDDKMVKGPVLKSVRVDPTNADSTLIIDDYLSDYYYYKGKNYTNDISGTNQNTYTDSNLVRVSVMYYGYEQGQTDGNMKGRVSLTEREDIIENIRCLPIENGTVEIELMDNPFMDKPTGYGFGGWTSPNGHISTDSNTNAQKLTVTASGEITVNVYAVWTTATVVYVNPIDGNDNLNNGLSESSPYGSWGKACQYIYQHSANRNDRERNIIVLTGNIDHSINYTRTVTGTQKSYGTVTYNSSTSFTNGGTYILATGTGANANALSTDLDGNITNEVLSNRYEPDEKSKWIITSYGNGYTIRNVATDEYLTYSRWYGLYTSTYSSTWTYSNRRFASSNRYLSYDDEWTVTNQQNSGQQFYFLTYNYVNEGTEIANIPATNISSNTNYQNYNLALTVTSLYNHTDYREDAVLSLTSSNNYDFTIRNDFQIDFVNINASGYRADTDGTSAGGPYLYGNGYNVRIGRGMYPKTNTAAGAATFRTVYGGSTSTTVGSTNNDNHAYKIVVETGKYSQIEGFHGSGTNSYYGTIYYTLGNDYDRAKRTNDQLKNYNRTTVNRSGGINGRRNVNDPAFIINVKSGSFGHDYISDYSSSDDTTYAGIYVGGHGTGASNSVRDISDRYCIVEGGNVANLIGGLKVTSGSGVKTRIYVKGGTVKNIVGGAGVSTTYEDRIIQVTGGTITYSISGGSNGVHAYESGQDGKLSNGQTLVYVGGTAQIGSTSATDSTLYGVAVGCVLGAGNGNDDIENSGQVNNSHIIINDSAHVLGSVYGGGNYGIVGDPARTTATAKVEILGGTIDGNVYGGANQNNIYGSTIVDVKAGTVLGAVYGGSNTTGTISTNATINVTGGTLGATTNTPENGALFGGGYGQGTTIAGNTTVNILDEDGNVNIYGAAYGGSSLGAIRGNTTVNIKDISNPSNTISIVGNVFAGGKGNTSTAATIAGNSTINVDGANLPQASVFGGNDINGETQGRILVNIGQNNQSTVLNAYGGGNEDDTGTEADVVYVYLYSNANVTNAFNGGKSADLTTSGTNDTTRAIYLQGGNATNIFGGSDTSGTVTASHVYIQSGTATNVYGGNNKGGQTTQSFVYVTGGTTDNVYGGGYQATTPTTNVSLTGGTITNGYGGGNAANVTTANITLNGTTSTNIYGGSNSAGTVGTTNVLITSGTVTDVYGGNNAGGNTVNTNVLVNSNAGNIYGGGNQALTSGNTNVVVTSQIENVFGGGNQAETTGNTFVRLTNSQISENAFGGGNGARAVVVGNSTIVVEGTTTIAQDLFGGGNAAANGTLSDADSVVTVLIKGGTITGDVYGAANTSVVHGDTAVKIGEAAVNNATYAKGSITIGGTVFGGGKSNLAGSDSYDFTFESVTGDVDILIDATGYNQNAETLSIGKSVFGSGNAAKITGDGYVTIKNYGTPGNVKENISIQRATVVTLDNCNMFLHGTTDRTNEIATAIYTFNRIEDLILKNNTTLYLASGVNIVAKLESLDSNGIKEHVTIGENGIVGTPNVNNKIYLSQGKNIILKTEEGNNGEVQGMAFVGLYKGNISTTGIYSTSYSHGNTIAASDLDLFERNSYVQGKHYASHNIQVDGFYTNYDNSGVIATKYIEPTPENADYYQWIAGKLSTDIYYEDIELIATKYSTTGAYVLQLDGLSAPNTIIKVMGFDTSDLTSDVTINMPNSIPSIAPTGADADTKFGLTMTSGNSGWQTRGTVNFLNNATYSNTFNGTTEFLSDNSTTTPTFSLYMDHSKNISSTAVLGTVTIHLQATYVENEEIKIRNAYIVIKLSRNNTVQLDNDYYEGAITPGKEYSMFPSTTTTITKKSSFSAYYSLFLGNYTGLVQANKYYTGFSGHYYHSLKSSCVLPENTKITLIDKSQTTTRYYYYIVNSNDVTNNKNTFRFTEFKCMDSTDEPYSADGSYYNSTQDLVYEEFIVQLDFEDTTLAESMLSQHLLIQLNDIYDDSVRLTVNTAMYPMLFSVYNDLDALATVNLVTDKDVIYMGDTIAMNVSANYSFQRNENNDVVFDTTHIEDELGLRITISSGSTFMTAQNLEGIYIRYKDKNYFARADGSYRMKIADAVANVTADLQLCTTNGNLETGTYTITVESFGSIDGTYYSSAIASTTKNIQILRSNYGLTIDLDEDEVLIDKITGKNNDDTNDLTFTIGYSGNFANPKITVTLYRRKYDQINSYEYDKVNLASYVTNPLTYTTSEWEYLVSSNLRNTQDYILTMGENLMTGTYNFVFSLYDNDMLIANMRKPIIIK